MNLNDDGKQERRRKWMFPSITRCLRKAQYLIENRVKAILNLKSLTPSWDSNLASLDKLPSFNHLRHHHGLSFYQ